jgi:Helix-hairpin-helix domain
MSEHEFYADPTLFDHWQSSAGNWLCALGGKLCPYAWVIAFAALGGVLVVISLAVLGISMHDTVDPAGTTWNRSLAQGITSVVALAAAQTLFRRALDAWPRDAGIPRAVRRAARYVGWRWPGVGSRKPVSPTAAEHEAIQAFFSGVREAGVNMSIARALLVAGIRSPRQLRDASDSQLTAIRGVGPATVRKLRARFTRNA